LLEDEVARYTEPLAVDTDDESEILESVFVFDDTTGHSGATASLTHRRVFASILTTSLRNVMRSK
jgi:hypothetical protein